MSVACVPALNCLTCQDTTGACLSCPVGSGMVDTDIDNITETCEGLLHPIK